MPVEDRRFPDALNRITRLQMLTVDRFCLREEQPERARALAGKGKPVWKGR
jgi:hypothetical protein